MLNVVAEGLPGVFRYALENRQAEEPEEDEHAVPDGRIAVNGGDHVLDDLWAREHVGREVVHGQPDGDKGH